MRACTLTSPLCKSGTTPAAAEHIRITCLVKRSCGGRWKNPLATVAANLTGGRRPSHTLAEQQVLERQPGAPANRQNVGACAFGQERARPPGSPCGTQNYNLLPLRMDAGYVSLPPACRAARYPGRLPPPPPLKQAVNTGSVASPISAADSRGKVTPGTGPRATRGTDFPRLHRRALRTSRPA